jgi:hypothetical protein
MITNKDYVNDGGNFCPHCQSNDIEAEHFEVDSGHAWQPVSCNNCGSTWNDVYVLTGFTDFEKGESNED